MGLKFGGDSGQRVDGELEILDHLTADEVLLDDPLEVFRGDMLIPDAFGVDDGDGSAAADAEALAACAVDGSGRGGQVQFGESRFEVIPAFLSLLRVNAVRAGAEEDVAGDAVDAQAFGHLSGRQ